VLTLLSFLFALTLLIAVHEYGHYRMAVACKVPVLVFSIGFGKALYRWRSKHPRAGQNTEFVISALPLGGYVQMLDSREAAVPTDQLPFAFDQRSLKVRAAIVAAGPLANLLLAVVLFSAVAWWGHPKILPIIGRVEAGAAADLAGLKTGDRVLKVGSQEVRDAQHLRALIRGEVNPEDNAEELDKAAVWEIDRQGQSLSLAVKPLLTSLPGQPESSAVRRIGAVVGQPSDSEWVSAGFWEGLARGYGQVEQITLLTGQLIGQMLDGRGLFEAPERSLDHRGAGWAVCPKRFAVLFNFSGTDQRQFGTSQSPAIAHVGWGTPDVLSLGVSDRQTGFRCLATGFAKSRFGFVDFHHGLGFFQ